MARRDLPGAYRVTGQRGARVDSLPRCVFIEVTNRCNMLCATCPHTFHQYEPPGDLSMERFLWLLDQFPDMERAVLHGIGEPLINPLLPEMIAHLKARGVHVLFNSNGTLLDLEWQEVLVRSGLDEYRLSLNSADGARYARIHGKDLLPRVVHNLKGLVDTKRRLGSDVPRISIWCIGMKENVDDLPELIRLAARIGIPEVYLQRMTFDVEAGQRQGMAQAELALFGNLQQREAEAIARGEALARELSVAFRASGATDARGSLDAAARAEARPWSACVRPWTTAYITVNGNALPCCISPFATSEYTSLIMGNLDDSPFSEIWNGDRYGAWREALLGTDPSPACSGCGVCWSL